jgi:ribonuclease P protein component
LQRLQTRAQFEAVLKGPILAKTAHFAIHAQSLPLPGQAKLGLNLQEAALGALVPKRWARRAVTRNLLKRQIYALAPCLPQAPAPQAFVVRLRQSFSADQYQAAASEHLKQLVRMQLLRLYAQAQESARC